MCLACSGVHLAFCTLVRSRLGEVVVFIVPQLFYGLYNRCSPWKRLCSALSKNASLLLSASLTEDEEELRSTLTGPVAPEHMDTVHELPFHRPFLTFLYVIHLSASSCCGSICSSCCYRIRHVSCSALQVEFPQISESDGFPFICTS